MENILSVIQNNWMILLIAFIAILFIIALIKAVLKIAIFLLIIGVILVMFFDFTPEDLTRLGQDAFNKTQESYELIEPYVLAELENAEFIENEDGTYEIKSNSLSITGVKGDSKAEVHWKDSSFTIDLKEYGEKIREFIEQKSSEGSIENE